MSKVLTCTDFDSTTQTCIAQAWVDQSSWVDLLPTLAEGNAVGVAFFVALVSIAMVANIVTPPRY